MDETLGKVSPPTKEPCSIYPRVPGIDCGNFQHIFTMPHVTENLIQQLIEDLSQDGAFKSLKRYYDRTQRTLPLKRMLENWFMFLISDVALSSGFRF
jgi:hypothetical protein